MNEYDIQAMDELARKEKIKKDAENIGRPSLMRRIGSGALDVLFVAIVFVALMVLSAVVLFEPLGYFKAVEDINLQSKQSGLYVEKGGMLFSIHNAYDQTLSVEQNYNPAIEFFYKNDTRCITAGKLDEYNQAKEQSGLFTKDGEGNFVAKDNDSDEIRTFYQQQYDKAVDFLAQDESYVQSANKTFRIMMITLFVAILISTSIFYFVFPLVFKRGETLGQRICKICLIDSRDNTRAKKSQVFLRSLAVVVINFLLPLAIYVAFSTFTLAPVIVSTSIMCLTRYNKGPQDYVSQTHVVLKHHAEMAWSKQQGQL